jgi:hypothetical protein
VDQLRIESIIVRVQVESAKKSKSQKLQKNQYYLHFAIAKEDANNDLLL